MISPPLTLVDDMGNLRLQSDSIKTQKTLIRRPYDSINKHNFSALHSLPPHFSPTYGKLNPTPIFWKIRQAPGGFCTFYFRVDYTERTENFIFIPLRGEISFSVFPTGVHLILLYFIRADSQPRRFLFYFVDGGPLFGSLNLLKIIWYIVQVYIYLYPRGIRAEQNPYRFKNLEKLETNRLRNQQDLESSVFRFLKFWRKIQKSS